MSDEHETRRNRLRNRVRQLILMRETGPKRAGWHHARMRMIWQLHDQIRAEEAKSEEQKVQSAKRKA